MAYVICEPCVDVKDTACVAVCPVDCIYEFDGENMLFIQPEECIDCDACRPECPVEAIFPVAEVPGQWQSYIETNRVIFETRSTDEATGHDDAADDAEPEVAAASSAGGGFAGAITVTELSRDRILRVLQTVEEGVLDPEVALIQLTGLKAQAPARAAAPAAPEVAAPAPDIAAKIDAAVPDAVRDRIQVLPEDYRRPPTAPADDVEVDPVAAVIEQMPEPETPPARPDRQIAGLPGLIVRMSQPLLGALPAGRKYMLEGYAGSRAFSASAATWWNIALNVALAVAVSMKLAQIAVGDELWQISTKTNLFLLLAVVLTMTEAVARTWTVTAASAPAHRQYKGALYGWLTSWLVWPIIEALAKSFSHAPHDGVTPPDTAVPGGAVHMPDEMEKRRRYGMVHSVTATPDGYEIRLELPRVTPVSLRPRAARLPATMPDYSLKAWAEGGVLRIQGMLDDPAFADAVDRDADFPGSFIAEFVLADIGDDVNERYDADAKELVVRVAKRGRRLFLEDMGGAA